MPTSAKRTTTKKTIRADGVIAIGPDGAVSLRAFHLTGGSSGDLVAEAYRVIALALRRRAAVLGSRPTMSLRVTKRKP